MNENKQEQPQEIKQLKTTVLTLQQFIKTELKKLDETVTELPTKFHAVYEGLLTKEERQTIEDGDQLEFKAPLDIWKTYNPLHFQELPGYLYITGTNKFKKKTTMLTKVNAIETFYQIATFKNASEDMAKKVCDYIVSNRNYCFARMDNLSHLTGIQADAISEYKDNHPTPTDNEKKIIEFLTEVYKSNDKAISDVLWKFPMLIALDTNITKNKKGYVLTVKELREDPDYNPFIIDAPVTIKDLGAEIKLNVYENNPVALRQCLAHVNRANLYNDKINYQMTQTDGIFKTNPNGQMQIIWAVDLASKNEREIPVYIAMQFMGDDKNYKLSRKLNTFDEAVNSAITSLIVSGNDKITIDEVWRVMNGKQPTDTNYKPTPKQAQRVEDSIDAQRFTKCTLTLDELLNKRNMSINDSRCIDGILEDYLVSLQKIKIKLENGRTVTAYKVNNEPILYTYNKAIGHLLNPPLNVLDVTDILSVTDYVTEFTQYIVKRIENMKNGYLNSNKINIETIYNATGITPPEQRGDTPKQIQKQREQDTKKIRGILASLKAKKYIKNWKAITQNRQLKGIEIVLSKADKKPGTPS